MHNDSFQTNYISETGNHVGKANLPTIATVQNWFLLSCVDVVAPDATGAVVAFGDSITDGTRSTPNTNNRWPDHLARRMLSRSIPPKMGVLNAGIFGNRVLSEGTFNVGVNALARFDPDVLSQSGVTRDPNDPKRLLPAFDSCDHLHLNDAGYRAMAAAVDLSFFDLGQRASTGSTSRQQVRINKHIRENHSDGTGKKS